jgi:hypothetical protein
MQVTDCFFSFMLAAVCNQPQLDQEGHEEWSLPPSNTMPRALASPSHHGISLVCFGFAYSPCTRAVMQE